MMDADALAHLQHFQDSQGSEGSVLDAADVVFVQLPAGENESEGETSPQSPNGLLVIIDRAGQRSIPV